MTWNLGGMSVERILTHFEDVVRQGGHALQSVQVFLLQELCTRETTSLGRGTSQNTRENLTWRLTYHRSADEWRGTGVLVRKSSAVIWGAQLRGDAFIMQDVSWGGHNWSLMAAHLPCTSRLLRAGEVLDAWGECAATTPGSSAHLGSGLQRDLHAWGGWRAYGVNVPGVSGPPSAAVRSHDTQYGRLQNGELPPIQRQHAWAAT
mgnify:CR=1 FL=1